MPFKRGDYRPFVRASIDAFDLLQTATAVDLAGSTPYVNIFQVNPFTGDTISENIIREILATPPYSEPIQSIFPERPNVSLTSVEVKTEQQYGYAYNSIITLDFTVHRPNVVFSADEYSSWRELLVEGNAFVLEYGWTSNPGAVENDLLNGVGFYDRDSGLLVQARTRFLMVVVKYSVQSEADGKLRFNIEARTMGNVGMRHVSLFQELADEFGQQQATAPSPITALKRLYGSITGDDADKVAEAIQARVTALDEKNGFNLNKRRFIRLGDILDSLISPVLERMATRIGYKRADLFLGNFNKRAGSTSDDFGSQEMSSKSIGDFPVPIQMLRETLANVRLKGRLMRVESLIEALLSITRGQSRWSASSRFVPALFPISRDIDDDGGSVFMYSIVDAYDGSDVFDDENDSIPVESITKEQIFRKLRDRGVPVVELGSAMSVIKTFGFEINPEPLQRSIHAERQLSARKDRVQMVEQPDPAGLAGRANTNNIIPLTTMTGNIQMVGNFVFQLFSYVWVEFYGAYPISGVYNVRDRVDRIEPGTFSTTLGLISEGIDPFNTRRRLTGAELAEERRISAERSKQIEKNRRNQR